MIVNVILIFPSEIYTRGLIVAHELKFSSDEY